MRAERFILGLGEEAIATFALTPWRKGVMELNKMAVHQNHHARELATSDEPRWMFVDCGTSKP